MPLPQAFIDLVHSATVAALLTVRDFNAMAGVLNTPTERGPVPIVELSSYCLALGLTGGVLTLIEIPLGANIAPNVPMTVAIKTSLHKVLTLVQNDYRLTSADVDDPSFARGCDGLIGLGLLDSNGKALLLGLANNRRGKAEVILGRACTGVDCWQAAGGDS